MGCRQLHCWQHQWCEKYSYDRYSIWYHQKEWCTKDNSQQLASFMHTKFKWKHSISRQAELRTIPMDAKWGYEKLQNALELASLCPLLETQPDALHQIIINASSSMLALSRSIFEGETRYQNLASPFKWLIPRQALLGQERRVHLSPPASYRNPSGKQTILHSLPVTYTRTNESLQLKCSGRTRSEIWNCHDQ